MQNPLAKIYQIKHKRFIIDLFKEKITHAVSKQRTRSVYSSTRIYNYITLSAIMFVMTCSVLQIPGAN